MYYCTVHTARPMEVGLPGGGKVHFFARPNHYIVMLGRKSSHLTNKAEFAYVRHYKQHALYVLSIVVSSYEKVERLAAESSTCVCEC